ncbi:MAG: nucleotidyltransferase family protein [Bacteroidota bacterium]|nr:nucleotidyltransferase family protein [Bacteroidota bacterium]
MEAIILAGGLGTRLRSEVSDRPKCMAEINKQPFLYYWLKYLEKYDISKVVLSLGYMAEVVVSWIKENRQNFGFTIDYTIENEPLGTGGALRFATEKTANNDILVLNGDSIFMIDFDNLYQRYLQTEACIVLALKEMKDFDRYGSVIVDKIGNITSFEEKKFCKQGLINCGIYLINKEKTNLNNYPNKFSFEKEVLQKRKDIFGFAYEDYFIDIGIPEDYHKAQREIANKIL